MAEGVLVAQWLVNFIVLSTSSPRRFADALSPNPYPFQAYANSSSQDSRILLNCGKRLRLVNLGLALVFLASLMVTLPSVAKVPHNPLRQEQPDAEGYLKITNFFLQHGFNLEVNLDELQPTWPLPESTTSAFTRFGTPQINSGRGYLHTAVDLLPGDPNNSFEVRAPFAGKMALFDWHGEAVSGWATNDYKIVVAIWDPKSHVITQMMHIRPRIDLRTLKEGTFVDIAEGEILGLIADGIPGINRKYMDLVRHIHFSLIDGENRKALNPLLHLPYHDNTPPKIKEIYLLDDSAKAYTTLVSGRIDIAVNVSDRDTDSHRNFEVGSLAYTIRDQNGKILKSSERCYFDHLISAIDIDGKGNPLDHIDFKSSRHQTGKGHWSGTDYDNRDRRFRYVLTHIQAGPEGQCSITSDGEGFLTLDDSVRKITISVTAWDQSENTTSEEFVLQR